MLLHLEGGTEIQTANHRPYRYTRGAYWAHTVGADSATGRVQRGLHEGTCREGKGKNSQNRKALQSGNPN